MDSKTVIVVPAACVLVIFVSAALVSVACISFVFCLNATAAICYFNYFLFSCFGCVSV